jgi:N-acylneuraminate cytidylyltransferase
MRILALIAARGGSKRLPGKNIRILGEKPLIVWSIDVAKDIPEICDILVSTDDAAIATVCTEAGAIVPWLRPAELATDTASSVDVALHALDCYETEKGVVDGILLLQPTSPFRTKETILKGIELFIKNGQEPVLGVSPTQAHPMWTLKMDGDYVVPFFKEHGLGMRSQDLPAAYVVNGSLYLISPAELRSNRSFVGAKTIPLITESTKEALDIDTEWDWLVAEAAFAASSRKGITE